MVKSDSDAGRKQDPIWDAIQAEKCFSGYFYGNDAQCLEQAVMICEMNEVKGARVGSHDPLKS